MYTATLRDVACARMRNGRDRLESPPRTHSARRIRQASGTGMTEGTDIASERERTLGDGAARERLRDALVAVAGGDHAAFETLYKATSAKLFGICLRILQKRSDAEDVLQEIYVALWHKAALFDPERASPITWLAMIARNKAIDRARAGADQRTASIELAADVGDPAAGPAAAAESSDSNRRLGECLEALDARQRALIRTAFFEGVTYESLAARGGAPLGSIKSWIRRGLQKLKACLER
jgi:RNA polymerase sigma-70 factor (ECF subfamily)